MSNLDSDPQEEPCGPVVTTGPPPADMTLLPREVPLGGPRGIIVRRTLPHRDIRTIGAWCFADHYGPVELTDPGRHAMVVPPHPHIGLQTVSWLIEGEIEHRDSVGSQQAVRPGELSLMTAGSGIAHSEYSTSAARRLFGIQLWVALPDRTRAQAPHFEHHADLPTVQLPAARVTVFLGRFAEVASPAATYTPIVGAEVRLAPGAESSLSLDASFEHGVLAVDGGLQVDGYGVGPGELRYLGWGRDQVQLGSEAGATVLLLGGEPLAEELLMWWNFVGRTHEEIVQARARWEDGRFGAVVGDDRAPLPAPAIPGVRMMPRPSRGS